MFLSGIPIGERPKFLSGIPIGERPKFLSGFPIGQTPNFLPKILSGIPIGTRPKDHTPDLMGTTQEPWMTRDSISFLYNYISKNKYTNLLEYGCGSSTAYFLKVFNLNVTSIEDDKQWLIEVKNKLPNIYLNKWKYYLRPSTIKGNYKGSDNEDVYYDDYVNVVDSLETFDIIIVDGRCRSECIKKTIDKLNPGGLYVVDNAERRAYRNSINKIPKNWVSNVFETRVDTTIVWIKPSI
jgi:protein-L-isoaspartate O-methyltransferase